MPSKKYLYIYTAIKLLFIFLPLLLAVIVGWLFYSSRNYLIDDIRYDTSYNEILNTSDYSKFISEGYSFSSDTHLLSLNVQQNSDSLFTDFVVEFLDERLVDKVAVMYLNVVKSVSDSRRIQVFDSFYRPKQGENKFKVQNKYLTDGTTLMVGFFWKTEFGIKPIPSYEKISYTISR